MPRYIGPRMARVARLLVTQFKRLGLQRCGGTGGSSRLVGDQFCYMVGANRGSRFNLASCHRVWSTHMVSRKG